MERIAVEPRPKPHRVAALLVLLVAAATAGAVPSAARVGAPQASPTHGGAVVFASDLGLYAANLDSTGLTRLTRDRWDGEAVWSPDARRIAFARIRGGEPTAVFVLSPNGSGLRKVGQGVSPAWSPDGTRIAFMDDPVVMVEVATGARGTGPTGFTIVAPDGRGARRVESGEISTLEWSPDGTRIAYVVKKDDSLRLVNARTGETTRLTTVASDVVPWVALAWSPDGRQIAVDDGDQLALVDPAAGGKTKLAAVAPGFPNLAWSPDGRRLVVHDGKGLALVDVASARTAKLTGRGGSPEWSPDGARIAFVRDDPKQGDLRQVLTIGGDGRGERRIDSSITGDDVVDWCPNGTLVYSRPRSGGSGSDIWVAGGEGSGRRTVTHAFPTGADFTAPQCAAATIPVRPAAPLATVSLSPSRLLATRYAGDLVADGPRAAVAGGGVALWEPAGRLTRLALHGYTFAVAGRRVAAIDYEQESMTQGLGVAMPGAKTAYVDGAFEKGGELLENLAGDGELLVYNRREADRTWKLWRIVGAKKQLVEARTDAYAIVAVDAGRIAVLRPDGRLVILDPEGRRLAAFPLGMKGIEGVRLTGPRVVVLRNTTLEVREAARGRLLHRWRTRGGDLPVALEDASGNVAAYTAGIAIHLVRLSDGRDRLLALASEEGPAHADLEPEGLYYSYNRAGSAKPGRFAFVPLAELNARF